MPSVGILALPLRPLYNNMSLQYEAECLAHWPFTGMTLNKCTVLRIETLTGGPLCRERESPPVQVKELYSSLHDYVYASPCKTGVYNVQ